MQPGTIVGPFEIVAPLGAGGMGEVFKARDQRLGRFVALKFLSADAPAAARERFQREARAIAALSHPNICALHEIGEHEGRPYLVLELLEGETLRARLKRGLLPPATLVEFAAQIADGLDAAHRRGVLHRDLKPENIWVGPTGQIKVLDFGLAHLGEHEAAPEVGTLLTTPGMTLGTIPYMSPEQARGETLDARSDIFSFGAVYYEMATGRPPFQAPSPAALTAAILKDEPPPPDRLRPELSPRLGEIARRCLEKDPELRYQSAAEIRAEVRWLRRESSAAAVAAAAGEVSASPTVAGVPPAASGWATPATTPASDSQIALHLVRRRWPWLAAAAIIIAVGAVAGHDWLAGRAANATPHYIFRQLTFNGQVQDAAISRDGKFLAYVEATPAGPTLHTLAIATGSDVETVPAGNGCCRGPSFTPDGSMVYFWANGWIESVPLLGGPAHKIIGDTCSGAGFSPDGSRIAFIRSPPGANNTRLAAANADGSGAKTLATMAPDTGFVCYSYGPQGAPTFPAWSPDGEHIATAVLDRSGNYVAATVRVTDGQISLLEDTRHDGGIISGVGWAPNGRGLLAIGSARAGSGAQLWYADYPSGRVTQLTDDLAGYTGLAIAASGALVTLHSAPQYSIAVGNGAASDLRAISPANATYESGLAWTPGGQIVLNRNFGGRDQLWIEDADGNNARPIVADAQFSPFLPTVAPDGHIVFVDGAQPGVWRIDADGTEPTDLAHGLPATFPAVGLGGRWVFFYSSDTSGNQFVARVPLAGGAINTAWPGFIFADGLAVAPDGHRVFVVSRGADGGHAPVILDLAKSPPSVTQLPPFFSATKNYVNGQFAWMPDGKAISYVRRQGLVDNLWAMPIAGGKPYQLTHFTSLQIAGYAWSHDGRLAISRGQDSTDIVLATPDKATPEKSE